MNFLSDSVEAGITYKGERSDKVTGCPGTEQHLVYLGIGGGILELFEYKFQHLFKDMKVIEIYEGTTEIEKIIIVRNLLP